MNYIQIIHSFSIYIYFVIKVIELYNWQILWLTCIQGGTSQSDVHSPFALKTDTYSNQTPSTQCNIGTVTLPVIEL